jgi:integrase
VGRRRKGTVPPYLLHRSSGQAYSTVNGRPVYHGVYGTPESRARYREFVARWEETQAKAEPFGAAPGCTVQELVAAFLDFAAGHYRRRDGSPTHELGDFRRNLQALLDRHGTLPAAEFRARHLRELRDAWAARGLARTTVNQQAGRVRRVFRWGHGEGGLVPVEVLTSLEALSDLPEGAAHGNDPVPPAPEASVRAVQPYLSRQCGAMLRLQWHVGMRPGEVCAMRGREVRRDGLARLGRHAIRITTGGWVFQPEQHKNLRRGKFLAYVLGPQARAVLEPWLRVDPDEYLFQPREAMAEVRGVLRRARKSPVQPSQQHRSRGAGGRAAGERYLESSYYHAVLKACRKAGVEPFTPNMVRHSFVSRIEAEYDIEDARKSVGHGSVQTTLLYTERDLRRAAEIAEQHG